MTQQLDLLTWRPPSNVVPYPAAKRSGKVRRTTEVLARTKTRTAADRYWQNVVTLMAGQLRRAGIAEVEIEAQIAAFTEAVQRELERMAVDRRAQ